MQELLIARATSKCQTSISVNRTQNGAPVFPNIVPNAASVPSGTVQLAFADPIPQSLHAAGHAGRRAPVRASDLAMTVSYLWSSGVQFWSQRDLNLGEPRARSRPTPSTMPADNKVGNWFDAVFVAGNKVDTRYSNIYR